MDTTDAEAPRAPRGVGGCEDDDTSAVLESTAPNPIILEPLLLFVLLLLLLPLPRPLPPLTPPLRALELGLR